MEHAKTFFSELGRGGGFAILEEIELSFPEAKLSNAAEHIFLALPHIGGAFVHALKLDF